jgi:UDP-N-acetylmuramate dehydrogenase
VNIHREEQLARHTSLGVGGPVAILYDLRQPEQIAEAIALAHAEGLPLKILGCGSNLVIADRGVRAVAVRLVPEPFTPPWRILESTPTRVRVQLEGGANWDACVSALVDAGLSGVECLSGIPGQVGATVVQNVGAYGQELAQVLESVEVIDLDSGRRETWSAERCGLGYRNSVFRGSGSGRWLIARLVLGLRAGPAAEPSYGELGQALQAAPRPLSPALVREAVLQLRRSKSMVLDTLDPYARSAGSFFTNPVLPPAQTERAVALGCPKFAAPEGRVKLAAAWLIEQAGLVRGTRFEASPGRYPVQLSPRHALALVALGGVEGRDPTQAADVVACARWVTQRVEEHWGIALACEPLFGGFLASELEGLSTQAW